MSVRTLGDGATLKIGPAKSGGAEEGAGGAQRKGLFGSLLEATGKTRVGLSLFLYQNAPKIDPAFGNMSREDWAGLREGAPESAGLVCDALEARFGGAEAQARLADALGDAENGERRRRAAELLALLRRPLGPGPLAEALCRLQRGEGPPVGTSVDGVIAQLQVPGAEAHWIEHLRAPNAPPKRFRILCQRLAQWGGPAALEFLAGAIEEVQDSISFRAVVDGLASLLDEAEQAPRAAEALCGVFARVEDFSQPGLLAGPGMLPLKQLLAAAEIPCVGALLERIRDMRMKGKDLNLLKQAVAMQERVYVALLPEEERYAFLLEDPSVHECAKAARGLMGLEALSEDSREILRETYARLVERQSPFGWQGTAEALAAAILKFEGEAVLKTLPPLPAGRGTPAELYWAWAEKDLASAFESFRAAGAVGPEAELVRSGDAGSPRSDLEYALEKAGVYAWFDPEPHEAPPIYAELLRELAGGTGGWFEPKGISQKLGPKGLTVRFTQGAHALELFLPHHTKAEPGGWFRVGPVVEAVNALCELEGVPQRLHELAGDQRCFFLFGDAKVLFPLCDDLLIEVKGRERKQAREERVRGMREALWGD